MGIGLSGDALHDRRCLTPRQPPSGTGREERGSGVVTLLPPVIKHGPGVPVHWHNVSDIPTLDLQLGKTLARVLLPIKAQDLRDAEARPEEHRQ